MQVLLHERALARIEARLRELLPALEPIAMRDDGSLWRAGVQCTADEVQPAAAWANSDVYDGGPARDFMVLCLKSRSLRFMQSSAAGFDHPVFGLLVDNGVTLANSDASAIAIAEFVLGSVLDVWQQRQELCSAQVERRWQSLRFREVFGSRWLIIGMGNIGRQVAMRARAFGAHVTGVRRNVVGDEPADRMVVRSDLLQAVPESDVVVLCAPSNRDSLHIVDAQFLQHMRRDSILVNVARGALVDEAALLAALDRGTPAHAVLDVFETEPLPQDSPLWAHPSVRVSAHVAAHGSGFSARSDALFLDNLARFARAEPLHHVVPRAMVNADTGTAERR